MACITRNIGLHLRKSGLHFKKVWWICVTRYVGLHPRKSGLHHQKLVCMVCIYENLVCIILENPVCILKKVGLRYKIFWSALWKVGLHVRKSGLQKVGMHHNICMVCMILKILVCTCKSWSARSASKKTLVCRLLHEFHANL